MILWPDNLNKNPFLILPKHAGLPRHYRTAQFFKKSQEKYTYQYKIIESISS